MEDRADYVVVGAGTAGCVVAARLSESQDIAVMLLEAGGEDDHFWIGVPLGYGRLYDNPKYNWLYETEAEPGLGGSRSFQPRGKVIGGTGSINGSIYQRGQPEDFDHWAALGNTGWSYADVLPYFKRAEDNQRGPDEHYGVGGPLGVGAEAYPDPLGEAFLEAAVQAGYRRNVHGFNGASPEGFDFNQVSIRNGRRCSTATAYLHPAYKRSNLTVVAQAHATRVLFEGRTARAVEYRRNGALHTVHARREVILCGGAFNSPQLLQVSGVGSRALLDRLGVEVVAELPGVGANLQNHIGVGIKYQCSRPITVNDVVNSPLRKLLAGLQYVLFRRGVLTWSALTAAGMIRTLPEVQSPNVKIQLQNWNRAHSGRTRERMTFTPMSSFTVTAQLMHPDDRGSIMARTADSTVPPEIRFNYRFSDRDQRSILGGLRAVRTIMHQPAIAPFVVRELSPGPDCASDDDLIAFFRSRAIPANHPTSTCKMGEDPMAVVDPQLRVHHVHNLRVIDASIMPRTVGANPNATTVMIAEKGAAMILESPRSPQPALRASPARVVTVQGSVAP